MNKYVKNTNVLVLLCIILTHIFILIANSQQDLQYKQKMFESTGIIGYLRSYYL